MKRVLVIKDVSLWLTLNRHFSGDGTVRLEESPSLDAGFELAESERPDLVVCSVESAKRSLAELHRDFEDPRLQRIVVVCVDDSSGDSDRNAETREGFFVTTSKDFLAEVDRQIRVAAPATPTRPVELLAHFELADPTLPKPRRGFANILELSLDSILVESDDTLEHGDQLSLNFFLPADIDAGTKRENIRIECEIRRCLDPQKLHYTARVRNMSKGSATLLENFLRHRAYPGGVDE